MDNLPAPKSRIERFLAKACGMDVTTPEPGPGIEPFLYAIAYNTTPPVAGYRTEEWLAYVQGVTPAKPLELEGSCIIGNQKVDVKYFAVAAGMPGATLPEKPQNRKEEYWEYIATHRPTPGVLKYATGTNITLTDVVSGIDELQFVYGDTYQQTYSGENLFDVSTFVMGGMSNGQITTSSTRITNITMPLKVYPNTTYTISVNLGGDIIGFRIGVHQLDTNKGFISDSGWQQLVPDPYTFTTGPDTEYIGIVCSCSVTSTTVTTGTTESGYNASNPTQWLRGCTLNIIGDYISPSPDQPELVQTVTGEQTVNVHGKNLLGLDDFSGSFGSNQYTEFGNILDIKARYGIASSLDVSLNTFKYTKTSQYDSNQYWKFKGLQPNKNYTISCNYSITTSSATNVYLFGAYRAVSGNNLAQSFTTDSNGEAEFVNQFYGDAQNDVVELTNLMIEQGSTATTYQPYQSQDYTVNLSSKNLFDGKIELGSIDPANGSLVVNNSRTRSTDYIKVKPSTVYTFTRTAVAGFRWIVGYTANHTGVTDGNVQGQASAVGQGVQNEATFTFTTSATTEYIKWYDTNSTNVDELVMIEEGSTATSYEPYYNYELCKIGNYQDYIYKSGDDWYVHKATVKHIYNGTEDWNFFSLDGYDGKRGALALTDNYIGSGRQVIVSNYFHYASTAHEPGAGFTSGSNLYLYPDKTLTEMAQWTSWLASNTPSVYYVLRTATDTQITDATLVGQLNAIDSAVLPKPIAYITVNATGTNLPGPLKISYYGEEE